MNMRPISEKSAGLLLVPALMMLTVGCSRPGEDGVDGGTWMAVVDTLGNTTTVRTLEGSVWGGRAELVEIASIGSAEGEDPYLLGDVRGIAADSERIYVLDWQIFAVRVYDHQGVYLRDIGRQGQGPGEFRDPIAIGVYDEGDRLFVRDKVGGLVHIYSKEGDFIDSYRASVSGSFYGMTKNDEGQRGRGSVPARHPLYPCTWLYQWIQQQVCDGGNPPYWCPVRYPRCPLV